MGSRIRGHIRSNVVGYIALFAFAISGTANALPGKNSVDSGDIKNDQVKTVDVRNDTLSGGGLTAADLRTGSVTTAEVLDDTAAGGGLSSADLQAGSVGSSEVALDSLAVDDLGLDSVGASEIATGAVGTAEVINNDLTGADIADTGGGSLTGADISEGTLTTVSNANNASTLDGWDSSHFVDDADFYRRSSDPSGTVNEIVVDCFAGDYPVAGGFDNAGNEVDASEPSASGAGWRVYSAWPTANMIAYVTCLDV